VGTAERPSLWRRMEPGRLVVGALVEIGIKAYGAGAATAVALSDAETIRGKAEDAVKAVPNLMDQYHQAQYVVDHREQIQSAITYLNEHTLPQDELQSSMSRSTETLSSIETTYSEIGDAREALSGFPNPKDAYDNIKAAWDAKPDLDSIEHLVEVAGQVRPLVDEVDVLVPVYYGGMLNLMDNFASDEAVSTIVVMAVAFGLAAVIGRAAGFWVRRGRPGLFARVLQSLGARRFRHWYVGNLPTALGPGLHAAARERFQREIVADPETALDPETLQELELYFASRSDQLVR
jgi:hypothetical protein